MLIRPIDHEAAEDAAFEIIRLIEEEYMAGQVDDVAIENAEVLARAYLDLREKTNGIDPTREYRP